MKGADGMTFLQIQFHCDICTYLLYTLIEGKIMHCVVDQSGCAKGKLYVFKFFITCKKHNFADNIC